MCQARSVHYTLARKYQAHMRALKFLHKMILVPVKMKTASHMSQGNFEQNCGRDAQSNARTLLAVPIVKFLLGKCMNMCVTPLNRAEIFLNSK